MASWDVAVTAFNTLNAVREMIGTVCRDNIQPQAVLAAEKLGGGFPTFSARTNAAIAALHGNSESVRFQHLKAYLGINNGGLRRVMRQSPGLLRFFLFCTACRLCFTEAQVGDLVYEMLELTGLNVTYPASAFQLTEVIEAFCGHSECIIPHKELREMEKIVETRNLSKGLYQRMETKQLANLFKCLFEHLRDEKASVSITGHENGIWLATALTWLLADKACLYIDQDHIQGQRDARVIITLKLQHFGPWKLHVWQHSENPTSYVEFSNNTEAFNTLAKLPAKSTKVYLDQYCWSYIHSDESRRKAMRAVGSLATALVTVLTERGTLYLETRCQKSHAASRCRTAKLREIAKDCFERNVKSTLEGYGWEKPVDATTDAYMELVDQLRSVVIADSSLDGLAPEIEVLCTTYINTSVPTGIAVASVLDPALYIAADALVTSTANISSGERLIPPFDHYRRYFSSRVINSLFGCGLEINTFRRFAFQQLLPGYDLWDPGHVIVCCNGNVAGLAMLWKPVTEQRQILAIDVSIGQIRREERAFDSICELEFDSRVDYQDVEQRLLQERNRMVKSTDPSLGRPEKKARLSFATDVSAVYYQIQFRHYIVQVDGDGIEKKRRVSWIAAINHLATSIHLYAGSTIVNEMQDELGEKLFQGSDLYVAWASPFLAPPVKGATKRIMDTEGSEILRVFASSAIEENELCWDLYVRHHCSLLACVHVAEGMAQRPWVLIA
jgi:hypothetical protein